jgi:hypothetical protein
LIARLVHEASDWTTGGFFALDASLVPETLLARELLGSESGALPSLPSESAGAFARTSGGTVLVDRIEKLPKDLQHALALALGDTRYYRVGGGAAAARMSPDRLERRGPETLVQTGRSIPSSASVCVARDPHSGPARPATSCRWRARSRQARDRRELGRSPRRAASRARR